MTNEIRYFAIPQSSDHISQDLERTTSNSVHDGEHIISFIKDVTVYNGVRFLALYGLFTDSALVAI